MKLFKNIFIVFPPEKAFKSADEDTQLYEVCHKTETKNI